MVRLIAGLVAGLFLLGANAATQSDTREQIASLKAQHVRVETDPRTGTARLIGAWPQAPLLVPSVNEVSRADFAAMEAAKHFGPLFGVAQPDRDLHHFGESRKRDGGSLHRYRQMHQGVPVLTGELLVNLDKYRRVVSIVGEISSDLTVSTRPAINLGEARRLALEAVAKWYNVRKLPLQASMPELWVVDPRMLKPGDRGARLVWRVEVTDKREPNSVRELLFIDAYWIWSTHAYKVRIGFLTDCSKRIQDHRLMSKKSLCNASGFDYNTLGTF